MKKQLILFMLFFIGGVLFLLPNFYRDRWSTVDPVYYDDWQSRYDRTIIARLVKTRQDGFFSAGGLLGLGDVVEWSYLNRVHKHQYDVYLNHKVFITYLPYKSHPGAQGIVFGIFDRLTNFRESQKIKIYRGTVGLASAITIALLCAGIAVEFGWLSGILILVFSAFSSWMILPASSIYWNLWAYYLPFVIVAYLLADSLKNKIYNATKIHWWVFITVLIKTLFTGFEIITTVLVMTTVPFIYYAIYNRWDIRTCIVRMIKAGIASFMATLTGLFILSIQITLNDGNFSSAINYILSTFDRRAATGNPDNYDGIYAEAMRASTLSVIEKYLTINALDIHLPHLTIQVTYWQLVITFMFFTLLFILVNKLRSNINSINKGTALIGATWYSLLAPLSWFIIFKPSSYTHPHIFPMAWQMPFVLLGLALCGFVIQDLFKTLSSKTISLPSPASQTD